MAVSLQKNKIIFRGLILFIWMSIIFSFSTIEGSPESLTPPFWYFLERKGAHVFEYGVLFFLSFSFFRAIFMKERLLRVLLLTSVFSMMYAVTDELHQFFVPYRGARMADVLIDSGSVLLCASLFFILSCKQGKKT